MKYLSAIKDMRDAVKSCDMVLAQIRFGTYESEIKISKIEAMLVLASFADEAKPENYEMYSGFFGYICKNNYLHMG